MVKVGGTCQFIDEGGVVNALHEGGGGDCGLRYVC